MAPTRTACPLSHHSAVRFSWRHRIVDDSEGKVETDARRIRGIRLEVLRVNGKYDDANLVEHRQQMTANLERRGRGLDAVGDWRTRRHQP